MSATLGQGNQILNLILQQKIPGERLQDLIEKGLLGDLFQADPAKINRRSFRQLIGIARPSTKFPVTVSFDGIADRIKFAGRYNYGEKRKDYEIVVELLSAKCFRARWTDYILSDLVMENLRPATLLELLALQAQHVGSLEDLRPIEHDYMSVHIRCLDWRYEWHDASARYGSGETYVPCLRIKDGKIAQDFDNKDVVYEDDYIAAVEIKK